MSINKNIIETIGNTPMVDVSDISPNEVKIFADQKSVVKIHNLDFSYENP